jgi:hypothetical protein
MRLDILNLEEKMERGHTYLEVIVISAIICVTAFAGLEIIVRATNFKNKASLNLYLTISAIEKINEIKDILKRGEKPEIYEDFSRDPSTKRKVFRKWELKEKEDLIEIRVVSFTKDKNGRKVEVSDYYWKKGGF